MASLVETLLRLTEPYADRWQSPSLLLNPRSADALRNDPGFEEAPASVQALTAGLRGHIPVPHIPFPGLRLAVWARNDVPQGYVHVRVTRDSGYLDEYEYIHFRIPEPPVIGPSVWELLVAD